MFRDKRASGTVGHMKKLVKFVAVVALALTGTVVTATAASADSIGCRPSIHDPGNLPLCQPDWP